MNQPVDGRVAQDALFPSRLRVVKAVGWVTFREIVRDKVLYNILLCSALLFGISFLASRLTFIRPDRVLLDFGLSAVRLSCAMIAAFNGAAMLGREFERRTILVALSRPISRHQFIAGKYLGLVEVLTVNALILGLAFGIMVWGISGETSLVLNWSFFQSLAMALLESFVIGAISVLFSAFFTTSLSAIITVGLYLIGHNISQVLLAASRVRVAWVAAVIRSGALLLPNLEHFDLGTQLTYGLPVSWRFCAIGAAYAAVSVAVYLLLAGWLARGRET